MFTNVLKKKCLLLILLGLINHPSFAVSEGLIQSEKDKSPEFLLGKSTRPNMEIQSQDNPEMKFNLGLRFMGSFETISKSTGTQRTYDFYGRRVRLEAGASFTKKLSFKMDLRNDRANFADKGEKFFHVGDAKLTLKKPFDNDYVNFYFYRAKVDVSRTQTVSSADLIAYDRPYITDFAADYVSQSRRATNITLFGNWEERVSYSLVVGDGITSSKLEDAKGKAAVSIASQSPMIGAKIKVAPIEGWEDPKPSESYFGQGKHFTVGLGVFNTSSIVFTPVTAGAATTVNHTLWNFELSGHYEGFFISAEYFQFDNMIRDFTVNPNETGKSRGGYVTMEYCFANLNFLAPFIRFETWNKFQSDPAYRVISKMAGVNWYLKGNSVKVGASYQVDDLGSAIGGRTDNIFRLTSQIHF